MVHWPNYLAPWIHNIAPGTSQQFMYFVGATEMLAGVIVGIKPRYGAYVVAGWLAGIIVNLLTYSGFYDIALRDFGLMLVRSPSPASPASTTRRCDSLGADPHRSATSRCRRPRHLALRPG